MVNVLLYPNEAFPPKDVENRFFLLDEFPSRGNKVWCLIDDEDKLSNSFSLFVKYLWLSDSDCK